MLYENRIDKTMQPHERRMCHHPRPRSEKRDDHPHTCVHDRDSLSLSTAFLLHASNMTATHHIIIVQNHQVGSLIISSFDSSCYDDMIFHTVPARTRVAHPRSLGSYVLIPINGERDCSFCFVTVPVPTVPVYEYMYYERH